MDSGNFFNSSESTYHTEGDTYEQKQSEKKCELLSVVSRVPVLQHADRLDAGMNEVVIHKQGETVFAERRHQSFAIVMQRAFERTVMRVKHLLEIVGHHDRTL